MKMNYALLLMAILFSACTKTLVTQSDKLTDEGLEGKQKMAIVYMGDRDPAIEYLFENSVAKGLPSRFKAISARELIKDTTGTVADNLKILQDNGVTSLLVVQLVDFSVDTVQSQVAQSNTPSLLEDHSMGFYGHQYYGVDGSTQVREKSISESFDKSRPFTVSVKRVVRLQGDIYDVASRDRIYNCRTSVENPQSVKALGKSFGKAVGKDAKEKQAY